MRPLLRHGHFAFESGHHGDTWLDLDRLITDPARVRAAAEALAPRLARFGADLVVGPLDGGAFLAQWVAAALGARFAYTTRTVDAAGPRYTVPAGLDVDGARAVVVDDAVNLGSATEATVRALADRGAVTAALASVFVCAPTGPQVGPRLGVDQIWLTQLETAVWPSSDCPLCLDGEPLST
ncbi:orotate phosphoribosyltransferase [Actinokineospora iranica]|uniref:Orotate phosphoribosyltransferase n=1 Tax=Actinokineospora iranica TaxID=1271860 RepID=A0A1G6J5I4_9PSEU|nr:phosphoribosyltransferase family protein [Actinokineospora iranica]SDC14018.1 orotate phosphoribosyltransferase [Actinokineospora iranica]